MEMKRGGLRMVLEKVRRRGLCYLPPVSIVIFLLYFIIIFLNVISLFAI